MKPTLKARGCKRLKSAHEKLLSKYIFNFNLRRYTVATQEWVQLPSPPAMEPRFGHSAAVVGRG
jgi:hypothetical protein